MTTSRARRLPAAAALVPLVAAAVLLSGPVGAQEDPDALGTATAPPDLRAWPASPPLSAAAHLLLDVDADVVLAARRADEPRAVASTVKMLTAITVRRLLPDPEAVVVLGDEVADVEGAATLLAPGDERTVRQLLEALLVRSGNDAAEALAVAAAGSREAFVDELRRDARRLGLDGAVLRSPSGLEDRNRLTARHLADVAVALLDDPLLAAVVDLPAIDLPGVGLVENRNALVLRDPTVTGVKTGFTDEAGNSVVVAAERDGRTYVAVVLGSPEPEARFEDAARLLDHAAGFVRTAPSGSHVVACAGPDGVLAAPAALLLAPVGVALTTQPARVDCDAPGATARVLADGEAWMELPTELDRVADTPDDPDAALGRALVDGLQTALRAVPPVG